MSYFYKNVFLALLTTGAGMYDAEKPLLHEADELAELPDPVQQT